MKSNRPLSEIAARVLAAEANEPVETTPESRARVIAAIAKTMGERKAPRGLRWQKGLGALAIAAAIALAVGVSWRHSERSEAPVANVVTAPTAAASFVRGSPIVVRGGARQEIFDGKRLEAGDRLVVDPGSRTTVAFSNGTYLLVNERSDLVLVSAAPRMMFELETGSVHADVAKLKPDERFVIRTSDAEIEVHGTSFDVVRVPADPMCGNGTTTRVSVREGTVAVRSGGTETFVHANEAWPQCSRPTTTATAAPAEASVAHGIAPRQKTPASDLAAQNDQYEKGLARKRAGDAIGAIAAFDELLARYPTSHLAQSARAERMKLLRGVDREKARAAARSYLDAYPTGFARRDAELILAD